MSVCARAAALLCAAAVSVSSAFAQSAPSVPSATPSVLAVPYLPQTEALCGGAAAAMVMRYWGAQDIYPDAFAPLVDRSAGGIRTSALVGALEARSWTAVAGPGDGEQMSRELGARPSGDRAHRGSSRAAITTSWSWRRRGRRSSCTIPRAAPSRVVDVAKFDAAWQKSQRWMLILLPPAPGSGLRSGAGAGVSLPDLDDADRAAEA